MVRKKYSNREMGFVIFCTTIFILFLCFYIWHQMEFVRMGYEIGKLEEKAFLSQKEVEKLEAKKSALLSLERVEKIAADKLNLSKPKKEQLVYDDFIHNLEP